MGPVPSKRTGPFYCTAAALLAFVYDRTHSPTWVALTTAARVAPIVVLGPLGGTLADRHDRRVVMIVSDAVRAGAMALLAAVTVTGLPVSSPRCWRR